MAAKLGPGFKSFWFRSQVVPVAGVPPEVIEEIAVSRIIFDMTSSMLRRRSSRSTSRASTAQRSFRLWPGSFIFKALQSCQESLREAAALKYAVKDDGAVKEVPPAAPAGESEPIVGAEDDAEMGESEEAASDPALDSDHGDAPL